MILCEALGHGCGGAPGRTLRKGAQGLAEPRPLIPKAHGFTAPLNWRMALESQLQPVLP